MWVAFYLWLSIFDNIKSRFLISAFFDENFINNRGNADVFSSILNMFKKHRSQLYTERAAFYAASQAPPYFEECDGIRAKYFMTEEASLSFQCSNGIKKSFEHLWGARIDNTFLL